MKVEKPLGQKTKLLDQYREELFSMRSKGYSYRQIVEFLARKDIIVSLNTVRNYLLN
ncbi:hypothetical protein ArsFIN_43500 (plasmid) [Arsenophonus nasoniae]|uniref:Uncharacterized protein n=1 Tax=Arsenophonus nasoniae TaxID=638 RepID=A0A4P7KZ83_9GAMM|nr:hypothetical protein [Arsenophonus nasoniae]QBY45739.1 hypothetical protein ArsFIN_43500 [Arsenophonus nasoniae]